MCFPFTLASSSQEATGMKNWKARVSDKAAIDGTVLKGMSQVRCEEDP
jgi:hypothetical protein